MKKLALALSLLVASTVASAHGWERGGYRGGYGHYENHYHGGGYNWVAPALIGGIIGYELSQPRTVYVQPQPQVIYQQPQVVYTQPTYHHESMYDSYCGCYKDVLVRD